MASRSRSQSTPAGSWKEPTRFLPAPVSMPVLPPTAASTMASSEVGTCTTRTPRSQVAATKPPTSVVAPPPTVTTASERVNPAAPSRSQQSATTAARLGGLAVGQLEVQHLVARAGRPRQARARAPARPGGRRRPAAPGSRSSTPCPTSTSYGAAPATRMVVMQQRLDDLGGDLGRRAAVGVDDEGRDRLVDRRALVEQRLDPAAHVAEQQRSRAAEPDPLHRVGEPDPEEDHRVPGEQLAGGRVEHRSPAEREHAVVGRRAPRRRPCARGRGSAPRRTPRRCRRCVRPSSASTSASVSRAATPQASASSAPTVVLPAPIGPTSTTREASPEPQRVQVGLGVAAGLLRPSRRRTSPAPRRPAPARPSPRRRCRRPGRRRRRSAGGARPPPRRWRRRRCGARGARSRSASSRRGPGAPRRWSCRPRCRRSAR